MNRKEKFLHPLPKRFHRQKYLEIAKELNTPVKQPRLYDQFHKVQPHRP